MPGFGRLATWRSRSVVPQCCASQASAAGIGSDPAAGSLPASAAARADRTDRPTAPDQGRGAGVMRLHPVAELPRQDVAAGHRQRPPAGWLGDRADKNVLLDGGAIQPPRDHPRAASRRGEGLDTRRRPADRQMMIQPVADRAGRGPRRRAWRRAPATRFRGGRPAAPAVTPGRRQPDRCPRDTGQTPSRHRSSIPAGLSLTRPARWT